MDEARTPQSTQTMNMLDRYRELEQLTAWSARTDPIANPWPTRQTAIELTLPSTLALLDRLVPIRPRHQTDPTTTPSSQKSKPRRKGRRDH